MEKKNYYTLENFGCIKDCENCPFDAECKDCGKYGTPEKNCDGNCENCTGCVENQGEDE